MRGRAEIDAERAAIFEAMVGAIPNDAQTVVVLMAALDVVHQLLMHHGFEPAVLVTYHEFNMQLLAELMKVGRGRVTLQ